MPLTDDSESEVAHLKLSERQNIISSIVEQEGPITGEQIARRLNVSRAALRSDLAILTMVGLVDARPKVGYYYVGRDNFNPVADQLASYTVKDILSQPVVVSDTSTAHDAVVAIFTEDIGTILVSDGQYLVGIISRKDLLRGAMGNSDLQNIPVSMIMTPMSKIVYAEPEDLVITAAQHLIDYEIDCLPVVEKVTIDGKKRLRIKGRLSKTNIVKLFVECGVRSHYQ